jgi:hypothetical protein
VPPSRREGAPHSDDNERSGCPRARTGAGTALASGSRAPDQGGARADRGRVRFLRLAVSGFAVSGVRVMTGGRPAAGPKHSDRHLDDNQMRLSRILNESPTVRPVRRLMIEAAYSL